MRDVITTLSPESYTIISYTHSTQGDATCQAVCMHSEVAIRLRHASSHCPALCHILLAVAYARPDRVGCWHMFRHRESRPWVLRLSTAVAGQKLKGPALPSMT